MSRIVFITILVTAALLACSETPLRTSAPRADVPPPLVLESTAHEAADVLVLLDDREPHEKSGLHHVFELSDNIVSGAEPDGEEALAAISAMGVKTILSVDGKTPDVDTAARYGLRYVHVPIRYSGIEDDELLMISKTFREAEGPFYVHCFHGKHRGPAAAAVGRVVLDGVPREQAIAEMRQWAGTSEKYEGLYQTIATGALPSAERTEGLDAELPATAPLEGLAAFMVQISRPYDAIKGMSKGDWQPPSDHPDLDPVNEAAILAALCERSDSLPDMADQPDDFRQWMADMTVEARSLHRTLKAARQSDAAADWDAVEPAFAAVTNTCNACHKVYRNL